jgi:hypothetical protein
MQSESRVPDLSRLGGALRIQAPGEGDAAAFRSIMCITASKDSFIYKLRTQLSNGQFASKKLADDYGTMLKKALRASFGERAVLNVRFLTAGPGRANSHNYSPNKQFHVDVRPGRTGQEQLVAITIPPHAHANTEFESGESCPKGAVPAFRADMVRHRAPPNRTHNAVFLILLGLETDVNAVVNRVAEVLAGPRALVTGTVDP